MQHRNEDQPQSLTDSLDAFLLAQFLQGAAELA